MTPCGLAANGSRADHRREIAAGLAARSWTALGWVFPPQPSRRRVWGCPSGVCSRVAFERACFVATPRYAARRVALFMFPEVRDDQRTVAPCLCLCCEVGGASLVVHGAKAALVKWRSSNAPCCAICQLASRVCHRVRVLCGRSFGLFFAGSQLATTDQSRPKKPTKVVFGHWRYDGDRKRFQSNRAGPCVTSPAPAHCAWRHLIQSIQSIVDMHGKQELFSSGSATVLKQCVQISK